MGSGLDLVMGNSLWVSDGFLVLVKDSQQFFLLFGLGQ